MLIIHSNIVHSTDEVPMEILHGKLIGVEKKTICFIEDYEKINELQLRFNFEKKDVITLSKTEFLMPGLIDTHIHAPQYGNSGKGQGLPLLDWLTSYTYPTEARFADTYFASMAYPTVISRTLRNGTTTACYFGSIHTDASLILCDTIEKLGQRAFVGKCNIDQQAPEYYLETTQSSLDDTCRFLDLVQAKNYKRVYPIITPRFAISCSSTLLSELASVAKSRNLPIQSHISENSEEIELVLKLFPNCSNYTEIYQSHGLLTSQCVMAHGIYLSDSELSTFKSTGASLSHCPNSNSSIKSGVLDLRKVLDYKIKCGLGTDVSGGYSPSILNAIRETISTSTFVSYSKPESYARVNYKEAFKLATLGGAQALNLDKIIGNFQVGKEFDALHINVSVNDSPIDAIEEDSIDDLVAKFIFLGDDRNIISSYIAGEKIF